MPTRLRPLFKAILPRVSSHRITGQIPQHLIPTELWEAIFHEVSLNRDLLRISTVCRTFNLLCIRIFLARNGCSDAIFTSPEVVALPHLLDAFHLSLRTFPLLQRFVCDLQRPDLRRDLEFVREIIVRSPNLRSVALRFCKDLFRFPANTVSRRALMSTFSVVLSGVAQRTVGPVFIFSTSEIFSCSPSDIASWNLDLFQFNRALGPRGMINRARRALNFTNELQISSFGVQTEIKLHTGKRHGVNDGVNALTSLITATIESITHDSGRLRSFVLLVFNINSIQNLSLRPAVDKIPPEDLSAVIMHVWLPYLRSVDIEKSTIDPAALRLFLSRHPTIEKIRYSIYGTQSATRPMIDPPLEHPGLKEIHVSAGDMTGLEDSPNVHTFAFAFSCLLSSARRAGLLISLRRISVRTGDITLRLCILGSHLKEPDAIFWSSGDEMSAVARTLHCLRFVELACFSVEAGLTVLPWLALLPAATNIQFRLHLTWGTPPVEEDDLESELAKFLAGAHAALPHVPGITGSVH
ncbi:hypothetical protein B0H19DRAFT_1129730 [Mycena capillaripes]|nr:hypothetical protein B0H19DRAFT_1129730 [Mycena capillaripes]